MHIVVQLHKGEDKMKKSIALLLVIGIVCASMPLTIFAQPGDAVTGMYYNADKDEYAEDEGVISAEIVSTDFTGAYLDYSQYATEDESTGLYNILIPKDAYVPLMYTNNADSDYQIDIETKSNSARSAEGQSEPVLTESTEGYFYRPYTFTADEETGTVNTAVAPSGSKRQGKMQVSINKYDAETQGYIAAGISPADQSELVYMDFKIRRVSNIDDPVTLTLYDDTGKSIVALYYQGNYYPQLQARENYGKDLLSSESPITNYCKNDSWECVRFIMDFNNGIVRVYVGDDWSRLKPFINGVESYLMKTAGASNLHRMYIGDKGSLGIDDLSIYTVRPPITPVGEVTMTAGKLNPGEKITAGYTYSCEGDIAEGSSYGWWEACEDASFINAEKISEAFSISSGSSYEYTIDDKSTGKFIRFAAVPVSINGTEGLTAYSDITEYKANHLDVSIKINGNIKNNTVWDFKHGTNYYKAEAMVTSTYAGAVNYTLIGAWYITEEDADGKEYQRLVSVKTLPITIENASDTETGLIFATYTTETVYSVPKGGDGTTPTMKVMLVKNLSELVPICDYKYAGKNF